MLGRGGSEKAGSPSVQGRYSSDPELAIRVDRRGDDARRDAERAQRSARADPAELAIRGGFTASREGRAVASALPTPPARPRLHGPPPLSRDRPLRPRRRRRARCSRGGRPRTRSRQSLDDSRRRAALRVLRGAADGERQAGHPPRDVADHQGPVLPLQDHAGLPRGPQGGLGHARAAGRDRGRKGAGAGGPPRRRRVRHREVQRGVPRERPAPVQGPVGLSSPSGWATGSTSTSPTSRSRTTTSSPSGTCSSGSGTRGCSTRGHKIQWYSPANGTVLSSHEVSLGYKEVQDVSVTVRFPVVVEEPGTSLPGLDHDAVDAALERRARGRASDRLRQGPPAA